MSVRNFDLNQNEKSSDLSSDPQQLDFKDLQFHLPQVDFTELPEISDDLWFSLGALSYQKTSKRYFSLSVVLHALLAATVLFLHIPPSEELKKEIITIEIKDISGNQAPAVIPAPIKTAKAPSDSLEKIEPAAPFTHQQPVTQSVAPPPAAEPKAEDPEQIADEPVIKLKPIVAPKPAAKPVAKAAQATPPKAAAVTKASSPAPKATATSAATRPQLLAEESEVAVPESLDDIQSPTLDESSVKETEQQPKVVTLNKDLGKDLKKMAKEDADLVAKESENLNSMAQNLENETQENLKALEEQEKAEQAALQEANARRRQKEAQAIAAAEAAAAQQAQQTAKEKAAAANQGGNGQGDGDAEHTGAAPGVGQVRSLQDMRQMPGNPKPAYDYQERLRGDAGEVVFLAYVTRDGSTGQFKLVKSTGHKNLDLKTLNALKKWKFYPGQEGWVEFPFRWDLSGGTAEMPTLLRRR